MLAAALAALLSAYVDYEKKEINLKLVYFAADEAVANANLEYVYAKTSPDAGTPLRSERNASGRYFSFLPLSLGEIRGFKTRFHLYTMGSAKAYEGERRQVMKGTDGVVFIADKDPKKAAANVAALAQLKADLATNGYDFGAMVVVYQAVGAGDVAAVKRALALPADAQVFEADPPQGLGVFDTLKAAAKGMLMSLKKSATDAGR
jgi:mutual gliding-motility protein MglA